MLYYSLQVPDNNRCSLKIEYKLFNNPKHYGIRGYQNVGPEYWVGREGQQSSQKKKIYLLFLESYFNYFQDLSSSFFTSEPNTMVLLL